MAALLQLVAGCVSSASRADVEKHLLTDRATHDELHRLATDYEVGCPDVLEVRIEGRPEFSKSYTVGPDGRFDLGHYGKVRAEGRTPGDIAAVVASRFGARPDEVHVRVAEYASRQLVLVGEVAGRHRTVAYRGNETVLEVLQRVGGITQGAEPTEVYVLRSHLGDLQRPEVFHVDLKAIVLKHDESTNIRVTPYDQIYVGETRQARVEKCVPPWARPVYQTVWNMIPGNRPITDTSSSFAGWVRGWFSASEPASE